MKPILLVLAAGMGSRYGGVKQIDSVGANGECLLDYAVYDARAAGFGSVVFVIRRDIEADFRERLFDRVARNFDARYVFQSRETLLSGEQERLSRERRKPWGTVHAVLCAEDSLNAPFAVVNSDDYYGRSAFETLAEYLSSIPADCREHAMVGYTLGNTMSENGSVSRGVCSVSGGFLKSIEENLKIYRDGGKIVSEVDGEKKIMSGSEWVSMNLFGFSLKAFETFHEYWDNFMAVSASSEKAEALLPEAAGFIVRSGKGAIKFFESGESWFGMTYPADKETARMALARKTAAGFYPEKLWEK